MIQLGHCKGLTKVSRVEDLANKEGVSANFLVQILNDLRRAGMVVSRRGKMGGYALAKSPNEINLADIVKAIEGEVLTVDSDKQGESGQRVAELWQEIADTMETTMQSMSLADMMAGDDSMEYYI